MSNLFLRATPQGEVAKFPYTLNDFREDHPGTGMRRDPTDEALAVFYVFRVTITNEKPAETPYTRVELGTPVRDPDSGAWSVAWVETPLSQPELDAMRAGREVYIGEIIKRLAGRLTDEQIEAWSTGTPPADVKTTVLATGAPTARKRAALIDLSGASGPLTRTSDAVAAIAATYRITDEQLDTFFGITGG